MSNLVYKVLIRNGVADSDSFDIGGLTVVGMFIPSGIAGTKLGFKVADDAGTYFTAYDDTNTVMEKTFTAGSYMALNPQETAGMHKVKLYTDVNQTSDVYVKVVAKHVE